MRVGMKEFCGECGANFPPRIGEGTCEYCDPKVAERNNRACEVNFAPRGVACFVDNKDDCSGRCFSWQNLSINSRMYACTKHFNAVWAGEN